MAGMFFEEMDFMKGITIRAALPAEYDEVARVWMDSWVSIGLQAASEKLLADLRARVHKEVANEWSLHVADDAGRIAAMLALRLRDGYLDQLFVDPAYHGRGIGKMLLQFTRTTFPDEIWLRCVKLNEKAWSWYEREGFVLEKEEPHPDHGLMMRYYRWKKGSN